MESGGGDELVSFALKYGYWDSAGCPWEVAKLKVKKNTEGVITQVVIRPYDVRGIHWTLHNTEVGGKKTVYHMRVDPRSPFAEEDKRVLHRPLPDFASLREPYCLQGIPVHVGWGDEWGWYKPMTESDLREHSDRLGDLRGEVYDRRALKGAALLKGTALPGVERHLPTDAEKDLLERLQSRAPQTASGARDDPEQALADLLDALEDLGLIRDSISAS